MERVKWSEKAYKSFIIFGYNLCRFFSVWINTGSGKTSVTYCRLKKGIQFNIYLRFVSFYSTLLFIYSEFIKNRFLLALETQYTETKYILLLNIGFTLLFFVYLLLNFQLYLFVLFNLCDMNMWKVWKSFHNNAFINFAYGTY